MTEILGSRRGSILAWPLAAALMLGASIPAAGQPGAGPGATTAADAAAADGAETNESGAAEQDKPAEGSGSRGEAEGDPPPVLVAFELGEFFVKNYRPVEGAKTKLRFVLHATVREDEADRFERLYMKRQQRLRAQVIVSSRLAEDRDFQEPELTRFRHRMRIRLRRALPELKIEELYLSEFSYLVQ